MWAILHKQTKRFFLLPLESGGNNKEILKFEYSMQALNYIQVMLGDSKAFTIIDLENKKGKKRV